MRGYGVAATAPRKIKTRRTKGLVMAKVLEPRVLEGTV
jgi:hypothetical protein